MGTYNYITMKGLEEALGKALQPIKDDLQTVKDDLKHVRMRVNQMYDALAERGLQMTPKP